MREEISEVVEGLLRKMVDLLRKHWGDNLVSVVLFGSVARGNFGPDSDIDLFIVCRSFPREYTKRTAAFVEIERVLWEDMDAVEERYGFYPCFSAILKTQQEAQRFSRLYLDMQEEALLAGGEEPDGRRPRGARAASLLRASHRAGGSGSREGASFL